MLGRFTSRRSVAPQMAAQLRAQIEAPVAEASPDAAPPVGIGAPTIAPEPTTEPAAKPNPLLSEKLLDAKVRLHRRLIEEINLSVLEKMPDDEKIGRAHV